MRQRSPPPAGTPSKRGYTLELEEIVARGKNGRRFTCRTGKEIPGMAATSRPLVERSAVSRRRAAIPGEIPRPRRDRFLGLSANIAKPPQPASPHAGEWRCHGDPWRRSRRTSRARKPRWSRASWSPCSRVDARNSHGRTRPPRIGERRYPENPPISCREGDSAVRFYAVTFAAPSPERCLFDRPWT